MLWNERQKLEISVRSVTRFLNENGYFYLQAREKGLMKEDDLKKRVKFAKYYKKNLQKTFGHTMSYGFKHTLDQACAPKGRMWRKKSEGLAFGCTGKGRKEGTGGHVF